VRSGEDHRDGGDEDRDGGVERALGVQFGMTRWVGPTAGTFAAAVLLAAAAGYLGAVAASRARRMPVRPG
jgi:hypothetical protein